MPPSQAVLSPPQQSILSKRQKQSRNVQEVLSSLALIEKEPNTSQPQPHQNTDTGDSLQKGVTRSRQLHLQPAHNVTALPSASVVRALEVDTDEQLTAEHSLELIKILLHGSIATIAWARGLFSERHFGNLNFPSRECLWSYENCMQEQDPTKKFKQATTEGMKYLKRGSKPAVNRFLDKIEFALFDALARGILELVEFRLIEDGQNLDSVLETYTFSFSYHQHPVSGQRISVMNINTLHHGQHTIKGAQAQLSKAIEHLASFLQHMPTFLPAASQIVTCIKYTDLVGESYNPGGFAEAEDREPKFPDFEGCTVKRTNCMEYSTVFQQSKLSATHVQSLGSASPQNTPQHIGYTALPKITDISEGKMRSNAPGSVLGSIHENITVEARAAESIPISQVLLKASLTHDEQMFAEVQHTAEELDLDQTSGLDSQPPLLEPLKDGLSSHADRRAITNEEDSQHSDDSLMRRKLDSLMRPLPRDTSVVDTQSRDVECSFVSDTAALNVESQRANTISFTEASLLQSPTQSSKPTGAPASHQGVQYSQNVMADLDKRKPDHHDIDAPSIVACQCGSNKPSDHEIICNWCHTKQHAQCYGYHSKNDPRLPVEHACYECLFEHDKPLLEKLKSLAVLRGGIACIQKHGFTSITALQERMGIKEKPASLIPRILKSENILVKSSNASNCSQRPPNSWEIVTSGPAYDILMKKYCDPSLYLVHLLATPPMSMAPMAETQAQLNTNAEPEIPLSALDSSAVTLSRDFRRRLTAAPIDSDMVPGSPMGPPSTPVAASRKRPIWHVPQTPDNGRDTNKRRRSTRLLLDTTPTNCEATPTSEAIRDRAGGL